MLMVSCLLVDLHLCCNHCLYIRCVVCATQCYLNLSCTKHNMSHIRVLCRYAYMVHAPLFDWVIFHLQRLVCLLLCIGHHVVARLAVLIGIQTRSAFHCWPFSIKGGYSDSIEIGIGWSVEVCQQSARPDVGYGFAPQCNVFIGECLRVRAWLRLVCCQLSCDI